MDFIDGFIFTAYFIMALFSAVFEDESNQKQAVTSSEEMFEADNDSRFRVISRVEEDAELLDFLSSTHAVHSASELARLQLTALHHCKARLLLNASTACAEFWRMVEEGRCGSEWPRSRNSMRSKGKKTRKNDKHRHKAGSTVNDCPFFDGECDSAYPYRTLDGSCNSRERPLMGRAERAYQRYLPPDYADCIESPRAGSGHLPSPRLISTQLFQTPELPTSRIHTALHMHLGQLLDHDLDRTAISTLRDADTGELVHVQCGEGCSNQGAGTRACLPIPVPANDTFMNGLTCLKFVRSQQFPSDQCKLGARQQANQITAWLDASFVYGSSTRESDELRTFHAGLLRSVPHPDSKRGLLDLLPAGEDPSCKRAAPEHPCFKTGDSRENVQVGLMALHTVFTRYHNHIARHLSSEHNNWDDEQLFQESRRIVGAVWQHIVYKEYLPSVIGPEFTSKFELLPQRQGFYSGYTENATAANADIANVFATAAFRFGHSQISDTVLLADPTLRHRLHVPLSQTFFNPTLIYESGILQGRVSGVNAVVIGMAAQAGGAADSHYSRQVAGSLFTHSPPDGIGADLLAVNIQRGRDHGLPGYVEWRKWCNGILQEFDLDKYQLNEGASFNNLNDWIKNLDLRQLEDLYRQGSVSDVDVYPGAMLERHLPGAAVGPTFACIIAKQFRDLKRADRFYFENPGQFTLAQLADVRAQTLSGVLCVTLEDDPKDEAAALRFQKYSLLRPSNQIYLTNMTSRDERLLRALYYYSANEPRACAHHPALDFSLF